MTDRHALSVATVGFLCLVTTAALSADTLIMKDGRRVDGELVGIRDGVIEFIGQRGFLGRERLRIDRADVRRIELDELERDRFDRGRDDRGNANDRRDERPAGMREHTVTVDAAVQWADTGVDVRGGQEVYFSATGRVRWGPGNNDGPEGAERSPRNAGSPIPSRPAGGLIGRIGESTDYFFIGNEQGAIRMRASGRLFLGVNDDYLKDNTGRFRVVVYY